MTRPGLVPPLAPCVVSHNLALGGAQIAVLRMIQCLPDWVRERTTLYSQSDDTPLLDVALKSGLSVGKVTTEAPDDPSCWVLSYGKLDNLPQRPTSLILHSWDDEGWRYITRTVRQPQGPHRGGVSQQVLTASRRSSRRAGTTCAGVLPPPVTEFTMVKGRRGGKRIVVAWMGRPLESKGSALAAVAAEVRRAPRRPRLDRRRDRRQRVHPPHAGRDDGEARRAARELGVLDRLDLRPLDFDPFNYSERLAAPTSARQQPPRGFLMTAAEALTAACRRRHPLVRRRRLRAGRRQRLPIDWDEDPRKARHGQLRRDQAGDRVEAEDCLPTVKTGLPAANYKLPHAPHWPRTDAHELDQRRGAGDRPASLNPQRHAG
jgi:hypothetical protein